MSRTYTVFSSCGSGVATSSHVAASIKDGMAQRGLAVQVRTCGVMEMNGLLERVTPDAIVSTTSLETVKGLGDIKVFPGMPLLTGIQKTKLLDDLAAYLTSLEE